MTYLQAADPSPLAPRVLVTGALGNVGREVLRALGAHGIAARAADRSPERARAQLGAGADVTRLDFRDAATFAPALQGCTALFLLRPPAISDVRPTLLRLVDAAAAQGVRQVVFLSVAGAGGNRLVPHHAVEQHLKRLRGPMRWTLLRPGFFAQNLGDAYRRDLTLERRLYVPAGRGRVAFVDVRDVAEVAALAFAQPEAHHAQAYTLTGPEALYFEEVAALLTQALGERVRYVPASILGYLLHLRRQGLPLTQALVQAVLHVGLRFGQAEAVDPTLARLLGRPGRTMREYIRDHVALWQERRPQG
jgi:uncharacterized protein YbjT (DUF2867 family)